MGWSRRLLRAAWTCVGVVILAQLASCDGGEQARRNAKLARTHTQLAQDYIQKKNPEAAKEELLRALKYDSRNTEAHQLLGQIHFIEGVHAMNFLDRAQCLDGKAATEQRETANERFQAAQRHLLRSIELAGKEEKVDSDRLNYLANIALHFKRYDQAVGYATRALDNVLYTNRYMALGTRGWAYMQKGDHERAARDLRQALFHQPRFCVGRFRLAKVYYDTKQYQRAITELNKVTADEDCRFQDPYHLLGLVYSKTSRPAEALEQFEICIEKNRQSCIAAECQHYARLLAQ